MTTPMTGPQRTGGMTVKRLLIPLLLVATSLASVPAYSHHSFAAVYQGDTTITFKGKVVQFLYRNPHSVLHVLSVDDKGNEVRWAVEWQGATQLGASGISTETIRAGDPVIITGNPGRIEAEHRVLLLKIERTTDGFGWKNREGGTN